MKKFLLALCLCTVLSLLFATTAFAKETQSEAGEECVTAAENQQDSEATQSVSPEDQATPVPGSDNAANEETNAFLALYSQLSTHLPELFSALSLLGTCILAFCYKKGLLPILKNGIGAIGATTQEWKKTAESYAKDTKEICENENNSIQFTNSCIEKMQNSVAIIEQRLDALGDQKNENEIFRELMRGQVDMLYDIFLSSSLPQFEKDRVGKRVEQMKQMLAQKTEGEDGRAKE